MSDEHQEKEMKDVEETPQESTEPAAEETPQPAAEESREPAAAKEEPAQANNEPTAPAEGNAAADVGMKPIGSTLFLVIAFIAFAFVVIGTPISWMYRRAVPTSVYISLWSTETDNAGVITTTYVKDDTCKSRRDHFKAAEAFSIITIAFAFFAVVMGFVARGTGKGLKAGGVFAILSFISNLVCWAAGFRLYWYELCGAKSLNDQQYEISAGGALFVSAWVLTFVAIVIAFVDPKVPAVMPDVLLDKLGATLFAVGAFFSLAFTTIATPINFTYRYEATTWTRATLWHTTTSSGGVETKTAWRDVSCGDMPKYAKFGEAFAIIAIAASLFAVIAGLLATTGKVGRKVLIPVGLFAFLSSLLVVGAEASMYFQRFCAMDTLQDRKFEYGAGFVLFVVAFLVMLVVSLIQIVLALSQLSGAKDGNTKWSAVLFLVGSLIAIVFTIIGADQYVFVKSQGHGYIRVSWWNIDMRDATNAYSRNDFTCSKMEQYLNGGGALDIISIFFSAIAILLGVAQLTSAKLRVAASAVNLVASLMMLVSWALGVAAFYRD
ncbi:MAG: hypothetical protein KF881_14470, partial [Acidobacteria bacterium]|nr:hypothetical protein [Acidobacteriota bacterium]